MSESSLVLDINELARELKTSPRTIRRHLRARTFPIPQVKGIAVKYLWSRATVREFVDRGGVQAAGFRASKKRA